MSFNSLNTKITLVFFLILALFGATFAFYVEYEKRQIHTQANNYYEKISENLMKNKFPPYQMAEYLKDFHFESAGDPHEVLRDGKIVFNAKGFETVFYQDNYYLHVVTPFQKILFKDLSRYEQSYYGYIFFVFIFVVILLLYIWLIRSLKPLSDLKGEISKFAKGDFEIACKSDKKDEIAEVANEFDNAVKKIKLLLDSRQLFLRTIMHELKTPIAKGMIVSELIDDVKQKKRMATIFDKLNRLIDDLAKIEQIVSNNYKLKMHGCGVNDILNRSADKLMLENKESIVVETISDTKLNVDLELISLAIKNLIDNGLKYSKDTKVIIKEEPNQLLFISNGEKLQKSLEEYYKPFHSDTKSKNHGMGLGLYIVHSIAMMHGMRLEYEHKENQNIFILIYFH